MPKHLGDDLRVRRPCSPRPMRRSPPLRIPPRTTGSAGTPSCGRRSHSQPTGVSFGVSRPLTSGRCMERREELIAATVDTYGLHSDNAGKSRRVGFKQRVGVGRGMGSACGRARWRFPPQQQRQRQWLGNGDQRLASVPRERRTPGRAGGKHSGLSLCPCSRKCVGFSPRVDLCVPALALWVRRGNTFG